MPKSAVSLHLLPLVTKKATNPNVESENVAEMTDDYLIIKIFHIRFGKFD